MCGEEMKSCERTTAQKIRSAGMGRSTALSARFRVSGIGRLDWPWDGETGVWSFGSSEWPIASADTAEHKYGLSHAGQVADFDFLNVCESCGVVLTGGHRGCR